MTQNHTQKIPKEIADSCPNFTKLLDDISKNKLGKDGCSKHISRQLEETKARLYKEKEKYFEKFCIYQELKDISLEHQILTTSTPEKVVSNAKPKELLNHFLSVAETSSILVLSPGISLFGMNANEFQEYQIDPLLQNQQIQGIQNVLFPEIEDRISKRIKSLSHFFTSDAILDDSKENMDQFISSISNLKNQIERDRYQLEDLKFRREVLYWEYFKILCKFMELLAHVLMEFKLKWQFENDKILHQWLLARFRTMSLKLEVLKYQYLTETYNLDTVVALSKIRKHLEKAHHEAMEEMDEIVHKLMEYESIGMGFEKLVSEYSSILKEIEKNKWALSELHKSLAESKETSSALDDAFDSV